MWTFKATEYEVFEYDRSETFISELQLKIVQKDLKLAQKV